MYDPAIHLTNEEYKMKGGKSLVVQTVTEAPELYIIACCRANDEQLAYIETRLDFVLKLSENLTNKARVEVIDKLRLFTADGPAVELEAGQQKGGNFYCPCGIHADDACDIETAFRQKTMSLEERQEFILAGPVGKRNSLRKTKNIKPLQNLTSAELMEELIGRGILRKEILKKETKQRLAKELHGIQRVPAMLFNCPDEDLEKLNLQTYEIFQHEGLHDVAGHIENLFEELPMQVETSAEPQIKPKKPTSNHDRKSNSVKSKKSFRIIKVGKKILKMTQ